MNNQDIELVDLDTIYKNNGEKPILLLTGVAVTTSPGKDNKDNFKLYYVPNKFTSYWLKGVDNDWDAVYETIQQAKYYLKRQYSHSNVKWTTIKKNWKYRKKRK